VASTLETIIQPPMPVALITNTISRKNSIIDWFFESKRFFQNRDSFRLKFFTAASRISTLRGRAGRPHSHLELRRIGVSRMGLGRIFENSPSA
jgi:hypothetical protein